MTEAQTEAALAHIADVLGVQPGAAYPASTRVIAAAQSAFDQSLALIDSTAGLSAAETKGFEEIESFAPYHEMGAFRLGFTDYENRTIVTSHHGVAAQAYDRGVMAASLCHRLGL